ncbi:putative acyl-protein thioesterase-1 [Mrakia frigida]|uniref:putative acyl-protein thioesterase-1 n=1 Tax=Mrakia frigida TaxID=29902 RepID=UPI003FCC1718
MVSPLTYLTVAPTAKHTATVVFAHGLGDSGAGWLPVAKMLAPALPYVKWILPNAPELPITLAYGQSMPAWFDLSSLEKLTDAASEDVAGLTSSASAIQSIVLQSSLDLSPGRTVVGGFSQGCAVGLLAGLTKPENDTQRGKEIAKAVGGVVALSGWLPLRTSIEGRLHDGAKNLPIFWGHGKADQVVNWQFGNASIKLMTGDLGFKTVPAGTVSGPGCRFESYPGMGHSSSPEELKHLAQWLTEVLPPI